MNIENETLKKKLISKNAVAENIFSKIFFLSALISIMSLIVIIVFVFAKGVPAIMEIGLMDFLFGKLWRPSSNDFGILPMILGSIYATIGALLIGVPIGILTAVYISEIATKKIRRIIIPMVELLAGIPSVIYGFFGLIVIIPLIDKGFDNGGNSLLAAMIILGIMILPTIINISDASLRAVPKEYRENSLALGASKIQTIFGVVLPAAKSGVLTAVVLGLGRAIGETMAVILVAGNSPQIPNSIFDRFRSMTANIAIEMGYAFGLHQEALFATGVVLFVFIIILNLGLNLFIRKAGD
ncbi:MAG: phosphate ABC transporter permease subunit PstC [Clostridiales bacterium]|nr:phosphate ABC transporter permease subunit PstC [Clostridiales bacterium]